MADLLFCDLRRRRRERRFRAGNQCEIDDFTDEELRARYRFRRESILFITNLVAGHISRNTRRNHALPPLHQVLIALRFYTSGSFLQVIGDTFGVDKSTVSRVITDVSRALIVKQPRFIKWPSTNDECATIKNAFYLRGGFPCVIGCVFCLTWIHDAADNLVTFVAVLVGVYRRIRLTRRGFSLLIKTFINQ